MGTRAGAMLPGAVPPHWSDDAREATALFTAALDLLDRAGSYERAARALGLAKQALALANARRVGRQQAADPAGPEEAPPAA